MSKVLINLFDKLKLCVSEAINKAIQNGSLPNESVPGFSIEIPADRSHGDIATNAAMVSAKAFRTAPRKIADLILSNISLPDEMIEKVEIAGPGFINFFVNKNFYSNVLKEIKDLDEDYGKSNYGENKKVMVEFVSANPTGPMHLGNARGGALGDCLASVLQAAGYDVWREFYINDAGNQIDKFGLSLDVRYKQIWLGEDAVELPEDSYHGDDIKDLAKQFSDKYGKSFMDVDETERRNALVNFALPKNIERMKYDMERYKIKYDEWFHEKSLHENGEIMEVVNELSKRGLTYNSDGAVWYKATARGAEKDEVLIRKNGVPTYFVADIAYHRNKFIKRNFDICIDLWGSDHHGHVARMKDAMDAIGIDSNRLEILLFQFVRLVQNGEIVRMSKRTGKAIQLADLLDEVNSDAARFLFNMREANSVMDFDLDLAIKQDSQNPVYYVQYAHARICSIFTSLPEEVLKKYNSSIPDLSLLDKAEEIDLINHLSLYTNEIIQAAKDLDPTRITRYVISAANLFHKFYNSCRVRCEDENLMNSRLYLCDCVRIVIRNVLKMFKISVPEKM